MTRRMSCSMTVDAVRARTKTVTRRDPATWKTLAAGDRLMLVEKAMGLPRGATQVVLAEVEIVGVRIETIGMVSWEPGATAAEGLGHMSPDEFIRFWLDGHGHKPGAPYLRDTLCRRIEWRYIDG